MAVGKPWSPERVVSVELARELIEAQFPQLSPARVAALGEGWDNSVFSVDGEWVFRFPRRQIAVPLIERELRVLPALAGALPLPVPNPELIGTGGKRFPWTFAGHRMLPGRTADQAALTVEQRSAAAAPLGRFLHALHTLPLNAGPDSFDRLDAEWMRARTAERGDLSDLRHP